MRRGERLTLERETLLLSHVTTCAELLLIAAQMACVGTLKRVWRDRLLRWR